MKTTLDSVRTTDILEGVLEAHDRWAARYPGTSAARQPVHTVYGGAHLFRSDSAAKLGKLALEALESYGPNADSFSNAIGLEHSAEL
ncbi:MAG: phosphoenolpyruvate kinase, partial [Acidobacteria bacterium]|nr:phosphoenolpyruvate kinase [Acidobacteriota bacterium]